MMKNKQKVLIFSTAYFPFVAGAEVAIKEITDRLDDHFEFDIITARMDKNLPVSEKIGSANVFRLGNGHPLFDKIFLPFRGALFAWKLSGQKNYCCFWGVMISFGAGAAFLCNIARKIFRKPKIPIVLTLQEGDSENHFAYRWGGLINISWRLSLRRADAVTGLSNFLLNRAERFGYEGPKYLVPNGVDLRLFSKPVTEKSRKETVEILGKKDGDIFLVTVSRLTGKNAVDDIISALPRLPEKISLVIIGRGEEGAELQHLAERLKVKSRVKFIGFVDHKDLPKYLAVSDIFIRPSRSEGFGNSFIEAMAAGLPVIATPVGGIPDFIDDKETGFFCAPDNPQSIAQTVNFILENKKLADETA
jgi:glycosyltransferase involved in cell wall biosynthesis